MQRTLIFALVSFIALMSLINASPMPTAAPRIGRRQDSGAQTTAPYTSSYDPSKGINGNGCQQGSDGNTLTCCPDGYQNQSINGEQRCVKLGSSSGSDSDSGNDAPVGTGNGQDNGNDSNQGNDSGNIGDDGQTLTGIETGVSTYTSDGVIIVSHGISVQGSSTSTSLSTSTTSSSTSARSSNQSGTNGGSIVHVPVSLVLAVVGAVAIGAF